MSESTKVWLVLLAIAGFSWMAVNADYGRCVHKYGQDYSDDMASMEAAFR